MARLSPSDAALEGFRIAKEHPGVMLAWSAVYFGGILLIALAMMATLGPQFIALARKGQLLNADPQVVSGLLANSWPAFVLVLGMTALLMSILVAGVMRLVLRPSEHGFAYLRLGKDELRLTAANLICIVIYAAWGVVGLVFTAGANQSGAVGAFLAAAIVVVVGLWMGVRLSLLLPTIFVTGRISFPLAWDQTKGHFWSLLGMMVMAVIFYVIVYILFTIISFAVVELSGGQAAMQDIGRLSPLAAIATMITLVMQLLLQVLQMVMIYGPFATAYRTINEPEALPADAPAA